MVENYFWQLFDIIWLILLVSQINTILPLQTYSHKMHPPKRLVPRIRVTNFFQTEQLDHFLLNISNERELIPQKKINLLSIQIWPSFPSLISPSKSLNRNQSIYRSICINRYAFISYRSAYSDHVYSTMLLIERSSGKVVSASIPKGSPLSRLVRHVRSSQNCLFLY